jgi:predicted Rossmann-fold nucleotide-binding protein
MLAAAKGAAEAGGRTIGVTCRAFGRASANKYIDKEIITSTLEERLKKLVELGQAYIVLPGGTGTLLELAFVWELKNKGFIEQDKPIILVGDFWRPLAELVAKDDAESGRYLIFVDSADEIGAYLKKLI